MMGSWIKLWSALLILGCVTNKCGGAEEGVRVKRPRAPLAARSAAAVDADEGAARDPPQELDAPDRAAAETAPHAFLSPSVKEYLELGMSIPGKPGTDYPVLGMVPYTNFYCDDQPYPGFFADMDTRCQAWHYCDIDGRQASFLCPNGTVFSQAVASCDWWFNVQCSLSPRLYALNARLYRRPRKPRRPAAAALAQRPQPHRVITKQLLDDIFT